MALDRTNFMKFNKYLLLLLILSAGCGGKEFLEQDKDGIRFKGFVADDSDIKYPEKRSDAVLADTYQRELKGSIKLIQERHYEASLDGVGTVFTNSYKYANIDVMFGGTSFCPTGVYFDEANHDLYFDRDGFIMKDIHYSTDKAVKFIQYIFRDNQGNRIFFISKGMEKMDIDSNFIRYSKESYLPERKVTTEASTNGDATHFYQYDFNQNVVLEELRSNINLSSPLLYKRKYLYKYDQWGNWTGRTTAQTDPFMKGSYYVIGVTERQIEYW
jgi:hypothetical protein